jgi:hypothetical protein
LAVLSNSAISANAQKGRGGAIAINAQGVYVSPSSTISATSDRPDLNGIVQISTTQTPVDRGALRVATAPDIPKLRSVCQSQSVVNANQLINSGNGGLPVNPSVDLTSDQGWLPPKVPRTSSNLSKIAASDQLLDAQGWILSPDHKTFKLVVFGVQAHPQGLIAQSCTPFFKTSKR